MINSMSSAVRLIHKNIRVACGARVLGLLRTKPARAPLYALVAALFMAGCSASAPILEFPPFREPETPGGMVVVGYYPSWASEDDAYRVEDIPAHLLTHINVAFADVDSLSATVKVGFPQWDFPSGGRRGRAGNFAVLRALRARNPHLKLLISVGGWSWSAHFTEAARSPESRLKFIESAAQFVVTHGFDGVDIDWEYPASDGLQAGHARDTRNFTLLLSELRAELDRVGEERNKHYLLTIAAPGAAAMAERLELAEIHRYLDWLNVMTYDYAGYWSEKTNFNAPLYASSSPREPADSLLARANVHDTIEVYLNGGVPASKIVLGVPFFGKSWKGVVGENDGLFQKNDGLSDIGASWVSVSTVHEKMAHHWDEEAQVPWLHDAEAGLWVSYESPRSIGLKGAYALERGLAGAMFWELTGDSSSNELLRALLLGLSGE